MAVDKLVDSTQLDADLTTVANAIRTKGGTSASLAFPAGFVSAVEAIPTGGGGGVQSGTVTPAARTKSVSFDCGLTSINVLLIVPLNESPLKSGGKTFTGGYYSSNLFYKFFLATSNNTGSSMLAPSSGTENLQYDLDGTTVTLYSSRNAPTVNAGSFEAITYKWYAW